MMNDDDRIRALLSKVDSDFAQAAGTVIIPPRVTQRIVETLIRIELDLRAVMGS